jgi:hypothetical protein
MSVIYVSEHDARVMIRALVNRCPRRQAISYFTNIPLPQKAATLADLTKLVDGTPRIPADYEVELG